MKEKDLAFFKISCNLKLLFNLVVNNYKFKAVIPVRNISPENPILKQVLS